MKLEHNISVIKTQHQLIKGIQNYLSKQRNNLRDLKLTEQAMILLELLLKKMRALTKVIGMNNELGMMEFHSV